MSRRPIEFKDVLAARDRLRPFLVPTPLRSYAGLDEAVGHGVRVLVKHENHNPTNAFKVRNAFAVLTVLPEDLRRRGIVAATRGNHGLGLAWAGRRLGVPVTVCVPVGNNPEKNQAMRGLGCTLLECGADYDEAVEAAARLARERGLHMVHSTEDPLVLAGAGTMTLEILEEHPEIDALVLGVGGGSQAVGALTVAREMRPALRVFGVQAAGASAIHDSWHARKPIAGASAETFADGLATRGVYSLTFEPLLEGLAGFVTATDREIAAAMRVLLRTTHNLVEGAGAAGLAGLLKMGDALAGATVAIVLTGSNIDAGTLRRVMTGEI